MKSSPRELQATRTDARRGAGEFRRLRDRGGYEVGLEWVDGRVSRATIVAAVGGKCRVRSAHPLTVSSQGRAISATRPEPGVLEFQTNAGSTYVLSAATNPVR